MAQAFHLEVGEDHLATLTFDLPDRRANIFTREALAELDQLLVEGVTIADPATYYSQVVLPADMNLSF